MESLVLAWSGGKDSSLALYTILADERYRITSLLTIITGDYDRVSMHGIRRLLVEQQAETLGLPLIEVFFPASCDNQEYEKSMAAALTKFKKQGISLVTFGVKRYREENLAKLDMKAVFPLWGRNTLELAQKIPFEFGEVVKCGNFYFKDLLPLK